MPCSILGFSCQYGFSPPTQSIHVYGMTTWGIPALNLAMRSSILLGACVVLCLYFSRNYFIWSARYHLRECRPLTRSCQRCPPHTTLSRSDLQSVQYAIHVLLVRLGVQHWRTSVLALLADPRRTAPVKLYRRQRNGRARQALDNKYCNVVY